MGIPSRREESPRCRGLPDYRPCRTDHILPASAHRRQLASFARGVGSPAVQKPRPTVLIIDDEPLVRRVTRRALEAEVSVLEAADGEEGLALLDRPETTIDLVVTDFMMPKINGLGVIAVLARYRPELPVIGMTGHTDPA